MIIPKKTTLGISSLSIATILVIASLASVGMQTDAAARNIIFQEKFRESFASASETIVEGSIETSVFTEAFKTTSGDTEIVLLISQFDTSTDTFLLDFFGFGPADQLTVANNLASATFSGTITGFDFITGEEKTFTVDVDLTATGKAETINVGQHFITPDFKAVTNLNAKIRPASGSLDVSGDGITFSTDEASGQIGKVRAGQIIVERL
jgi:hypothetical protein